MDRRKESLDNNEVFIVNEEVKIDLDEKKFVLLEPGDKFRVIKEGKPKKEFSQDFIHDAIEYLAEIAKKADIGEFLTIIIEAYAEGNNKYDGKKDDLKVSEVRDNLVKDLRSFNIDAMKNYLGYNPDEGL